MTRPHISIFGSRYVLPKGLPKTGNVRNINDVKLYKVVVDTKNRFPLDSTVTRTDYEKVMRNYDLRIIRWTPGTLPKVTGRKLYYISGKNRELVKNVEVERADEIHESKDYILVVGDKVRPFNIVSEAKKIGSALWLDTIPETALSKKKVNEYKQLNFLK